MANITVVGAGIVGATLAGNLVAAKNDVVLLDPAGPGPAEVAAGGIARAEAIWGMRSAITGSSSWPAAAGSQIVIVTPRDDDHLWRLGWRGRAYFRAIASGIKDHAGDAIVIVATHDSAPVCQLIYEVTGFPAERIVGIGGAPESALLAAGIARHVGPDATIAQVWAFGSRQDRIVPLMSQVVVEGQPLGEILAPVTIPQIVTETRSIAYQNPATPFEMVAAAARFVHELLIGRGEPLPCTLLSCRAYGTEEVFLGLLGTFSTGGVQRAPDLTNLPPGELNDLRWVSGSLVSRLQQTAREE